MHSNPSGISRATRRSLWISLPKLVAGFPNWLILIAAATGLLLPALPDFAAQESRAWRRSSEFEETAFTTTLDDGIRINVNAPLDKSRQPARATRLVIYALPNGNTLEQTLGCALKPGLDWHYDIQHVAAQIRMLRKLMPDERIVLVCAEAPGLSWPSYRAKHHDAGTRIAHLVDDWRTEFGDEKTKVFLTGHSGGGGFIFSVIEGNEQIPAYIDRIAYLDSNYNFDAKTHAAKLEQWLKGDPQRRLVVIAYDDREITLNGKKVVGPTGGTFRATQRMRDAFGPTFPLKNFDVPPFRETTGLDDRIHFYVHSNPENKILHTVLVGEMNGLLQAATLGTPVEKSWGTFGGPRAYTKYIQSTVTVPSTKTILPAVGEPPKTAARKLPTQTQLQLPKRPQNAIGGHDFIKSLTGRSLDERETAIFHEITTGNFPNFLRQFKLVPLTGTLSKSGKEVSTTIAVMPDYMSIGNDQDFVRIPMTPQTAQQIADRFGCTMPTRKLVDTIDRAAELHVAPYPMTEAREAPATFLEHNDLVAQQCQGSPLGMLLIGTEKDIVLSPRIFEKPQRLAIYGWRQLNGQPIQPLTIVHWNRYVDYSHGVRLIRDEVQIDGKTEKLSEILADPHRCNLVSDEGPMQPPKYPPK